jgi:plastocyanin
VTSRQRLVNLGIAAVIAIVAVVVIVAGSGDSDSEKPAATPAATAAPSSQPSADATTSSTEAPDEPPPPEIVVKDGEVVGGIAEFRVKQGDRVRFSVTADVADEVHVHAYDFMKDIEHPGDTVTFDFKADITGITEVELEDAGLQIASLRVDP